MIETAAQFASTGVVYLNNRYHDPALGVFISVDPLVAATGEPYIYAGGNPTTLSDPLGLCKGGMREGDRGCGIDNGGSPGVNDGELMNNQRFCSWCGAELNYHKPNRHYQPDKNDGLFELIGGFVEPFGTGMDAFGCGKGVLKWDALNLVAGCGALLVPFGGKKLFEEFGQGGARWLDELFGGGARACGARSFSGDTEVLMGDGTTQPIAEIEIGDMVLAFDPVTGESGGREVTHVWVHQDLMLELDLGGASVTTTEDHPFWNVTDQTWQQAQHLEPGDQVLTADGDTLTVDGLDWTTTFIGTAYNLTVDDIHTYHVQAGDVEVLVHNCSPRAYDIADKTIDTHGLMGFKDADEMASYIDDVVNSQPGILRDDGALLYRDGDNIIIVPESYRNPGTLFRPDDPNRYWERELERTQYGG